MPHTFGLTPSAMAPVAALLLCTLPSPALGQWLNAPAARAPLTASGEVDLEAPPPKHANGRIDLQGVRKRLIKSVANKVIERQTNAGGAALCRRAGPRFLQERQRLLPVAQQ